MEIKATLLRSLTDYRVFNTGLNGFGYLVRTFNGRYVVGRSRSLAQIAPYTSSPGTLEITPEGIFINHDQKISTNSFLIEAFLEHAVTQIRIKAPLSYSDLLKISRGELAVSDRFELVEQSAGGAEELSQVRKYNNQKLMGFNALLSLCLGVEYATYKLLTLAAAVGSLSAVDVVCSSLLTFCTVVYASINALKQKFIFDSTKHVDPQATEAEKALVRGVGGPKVSVVIPAYNEPVDVLRKTLAAATNLHYTNYEVVLLLDSKPDSTNYAEVMALYNSEFKAGGRIKVFCRKAHPEVANQRLNKADNINAYVNFAHGRAVDGQTFSDSEVLLITDADYRLRPEFLEETVPILLRDQQNAYVMTPQNFPLDQGNAVEQANAALMSSSWQQINKGVAASSRVLFGGCNSIIRLSVLKEVATTRTTGEVDYLPTDTVTEDLALTLRFFERGYKGAYISRPLAEGDPIASLGDHFATFWRYSEGSIESTLRYTIPQIASGRMSRYSLETIDYLYKGLTPIATASLGLVALAPLAALLGIGFAHSTPLAALIYYFSLSQTAKVTLKTQGVKDPWANAKAATLMYMHFPIMINATYTAIRNYLTGREATFRVTRKDGQRTRLSLENLVPLLGLGTLNTVSSGLLFKLFITTHEWSYLEGSLWAMLPALAITYGLAKFNGVKNTASDFVTGFNLAISGAAARHYRIIQGFSLAASAFN